MTHIVIVTYRNRQEYLKTYLQTLSRASGYTEGQKELLLIDLGSDPNETQKIINDHHNKLKVDYHHIVYNDVFYKTKALNYALTNTSAEYVTITDIDCMFPSTFYPSTEKFFSIVENEGKKLAYNVLYIHQEDARKVGVVPTYCAEKIEGLEAWWKEHQSPRPRASMEWKYNKIGNSHITIKRQALIDIGGYDERIIGYGVEDLAVNMVLHKKGIETVISDCNLYHYRNKYESDWRSNDIESHSYSVFMGQERSGWKPLVRGEQWGKF